MRWRRSTQILWRSAPSYLALARVDGGHIEIRGPGDVVWELLEHEIDYRSLVDELARRFQADVEVVELDLRKLLLDLEREQYVVQCD